MTQDQINELNRQHRIERAKRYYRELAEAQGRLDSVRKQRAA